MATATSRKTSAKTRSTGRAAPAKKAAARAPRLAASDGKLIDEKPAPTLPGLPVKMSAKDRLAADVQALTADSGLRDTSFVITDYEALRAKLIDAMGADGLPRVRDFGDVLAAWEKRKQGVKGGADHIFIVHPLELNVMPNQNSRVFTTPERIVRVANMTDMVEHGVHTPVKAFFIGGKLWIKGGETRWRGVAHNWILKANDPTRKAPIGIPVLLEPPGVNDAKRHLDFALDNEHDSLTPIEVAMKYNDSFQCGMPVEGIAKYLGKRGQTGITHVESYLGMLAMPQAVINLILSGKIAMTLAFQWWKDSGNDAAKTLARIEAAEKQMTKKGATHIMPKHDEAAAAEEAEGDEATDTTTTVRTTRTVSRSAAESAAIKTLDMVASTPVTIDDEDGFLLMTFRPRLEDGLEMCRRLGLEVPKKYQSAA